MEDLLLLLRAAAEDTRLRILALAARDQLTVSEFVDILGQSQPRVSRHLKLMVEAGLLERFREGQWAYFRLARHPELAPVVEAIVAKLGAEGDLARLEDLRRRRENRAIAYFRTNAERWDQLRALHIDDAEIEKALVGLLPDDVGSLLDIGTGTGRILEVLARHAERATGIDQSREMLAVARTNLARAGLAQVEIRQADMYALPFASMSLDVVSIHQVLHYAEDPAAVLREAARVLAPGGTALIVDFAPHDLVELRREHAHVHLGFADNQVAGWLSAAGLDAAPPLHLPGKRLMVGIWRATKPRADTAVVPAETGAPLQENSR
ncbi:MAG: metalloregulator ArsR/SmtB family transcription factor [Alphaproteobacteria bacterium]|nr:metalloregulator ArsR/SmtB family transcription factor [Alphaproteobacteria bacterium]MCW5742347.1 metalloregulator ArsR/SmtB family transcription factor [Alphaproteobacteria bacterium]